jgi:hypothetical protein
LMNITSKHDEGDMWHIYPNHRMNEEGPYSTVMPRFIMNYYHNKVVISVQYSDDMSFLKLIYHVK